MIIDNRDNLIYSNKEIFDNISQYKNYYDEQCDKRIFKDLFIKLPKHYYVFDVDHYQGNVFLNGLKSENKNFPQSIMVEKSLLTFTYPTIFNSFQSSKSFYQSNWDINKIVIKYLLYNTDDKLYEYDFNFYKGFIHCKENEKVNDIKISIYNKDGVYYGDIQLYSLDSKIDKKLIAYLVSNIQFHTEQPDFKQIGLEYFSQNLFLEAQFPFAASYLSNKDYDSLYMLAMSNYKFYKSGQIDFPMDFIIDKLLTLDSDNQKAVELRRLYDIEEKLLRERNN